MNLFFFFVSVPLTLAAAAVLVENSDIKEVKKAFDAAHVRTIKDDDESNLMSFFFYLDSGRPSHHLRPENVAWSDVPSVIRIAIAHDCPSRNAAFQKWYAIFLFFEYSSPERADDLFQ